VRAHNGRSQRERAPATEQRATSWPIASSGTIRRRGMPLYSATAPWKRAIDADQTARRDALAAPDRRATRACSQRSPVGRCRGTHRAPAWRRTLGRARPRAQAGPRPGRAASSAAPPAVPSRPSTVSMRPEVVVRDGTAVRPGRSGGAIRARGERRGRLERAAREADDEPCEREQQERPSRASGRRGCAKRRGRALRTRMCGGWKGARRSGRARAATRARRP